MARFMPSYVADTDWDAFDVSTTLVSDHIYGSSAISFHVHMNKKETHTGYLYFNTKGDSDTTGIRIYHSETTEFGVAARSNNADSYQPVFQSPLVSTTGYFALGTSIDFAGDYVQLYVDGEANTGSSVTFTDNTYNIPDVYSSTPPCVGCWSDSAGYYLPFPGILEQMGMWSAVLTDEEFSALGAGVCPLLIRPESLIAYWPFDEPTTGADLRELVNGLTGVSYQNKASKDVSQTPIFRAPTQSILQFPSPLSVPQKLLSFSRHNRHNTIESSALKAR